MSTTAAPKRIWWLVAGVSLAAALHAAVPAGPHSWHWLHLLSQKLYYVPILMAAGWIGLKATLGTTLAISLLYAIHVLRDWAGLPMVQAEELAEVASFWVVAVVAGILFQRQRLAVEQVGLAHEETLGALASSLELRERYTAGHSRRVRDYALLLADELGLRDEAFRASLAIGALLHDVGKIGIPDRILLKEGPLSDEEWEEMRKHPDLGAALIGHIAFLRTARELVRAHHERYDGAGYPRGLAGEAIPLAARIFAVADTLDALTTDRPYQRALSYDEAAMQIARERGSHFDPDVVHAFLRIPFEAWSRLASTAGATLKAEICGDASGGEPPRGASKEDGPMKRPQQFLWRRSLRLRMSGWNAAVIALTVSALTGAAIFQERRQLLQVETAHAQALLDHLSWMPEFQGDRETAAVRVALLRESLHAAAIGLELVPRGQTRPVAPEGGGRKGNALATRSLSLREGLFDLRYVSDPLRLEAMMRRSVLMHLAYGLVALAALVGGTEWILRRNLVVPLRSLSDQLQRMRDGGGWFPHVPSTDAELADLAHAITDLGPALERQVYEWIEADRRSAVALAVNSIRGRLREPQARARALVAALQARGATGRDGGPNLGALLVELDQFSRALSDEEDAVLAVPRAGRAGG